MIPPSDQSGGATVGTAETILLVHGDILVRSALASYLRDCGYRVIEAANTAEAITLLEQDDASVSVVFTDVGMAGDSEGFELAQWVRRERPHVEVVMAGTPARAAAVAGDLCEDGPMRTKPYDPQSVAAEIRRLLAKRPQG